MPHFNHHDLTRCFYVADPSKLFFVPYCNGELRGECQQCQRRVCRGFWGGDNPSEVDEVEENHRQPTQRVAPYKQPPMTPQERENRVLALMGEYEKVEEFWDTPGVGVASPLDN